GFHDHDHGTDTDPATTNSPEWLNDTFAADDFGTTTSQEHIEGVLDPDSVFTLTSFHFEETVSDDYDYVVGGSEGAPEPGGSSSDSYYDHDHGHDGYHEIVDGRPTNWTATVDDNFATEFHDRDDDVEN